MTDKIDRMSTHPDAPRVLGMVRDKLPDLDPERRQEIVMSLMCIHVQHGLNLDYLEGLPYAEFRQIVVDLDECLGKGTYFLDRSFIDFEEMIDAQNDS
jgi:hypothetical protein